MNSTHAMCELLFLIEKDYKHAEQKKMWNQYTLTWVKATGNTVYKTIQVCVQSAPDRQQSIKERFQSKLNLGN